MQIDNTPLCDEIEVHGDIISKIGENLPPDRVMRDLSELFKMFGDGTRVRILYVLFEGEVCVCDIATILGMSQSAISHQLRLLKNARLVKYRREGKTVYYSLADQHVITIFNQGMEHVVE